MAALNISEATFQRMVRAMQPSAIRAIGRAQLDLNWLTPKELEAYVHGIPRALRKNSTVTPTSLLADADAGAITAHWAAQHLTYAVNRAVAGLARRGQLGQARRVISQLVAVRKVNGHTFAGFFKACALCQRPEVALEAWRPWSRSGLFSEISAFALLTCVETEDSLVAYRTLRQLEDAGVAMEVRTYNNTMRALMDDGHVNEALIAFEALQRTCREGPSVVTFQILFEGVRDNRAYSLLPDVYRDLDALSVQPDGQLSATMIRAFAYAQDVDTALEIFERTAMEWQLPLGQFHYNSLICAFARVGDWDATVATYQEMLSAGVAPGESTATLLVLSAARHRRVPVADIDAVIAHFESHGLHRNTHTCGALMHFFRTNELLQPYARVRAATNLLAWMRQAQVPRDVEVMNALIGTCVESMLFHLACAMYEELIGEDLVPTRRTFALMLEACAEQGDLERAREFSQLRDSMRLVMGVPDGSGSAWDVDADYEL